MRKELKRFAEQQEKILQENDHKGGWQNETDEYLFHRLLEEVSELYLAIQSYPDTITDECCDVANLAMMIADNNRSENENF